MQTHSENEIYTLDIMHPPCRKENHSSHPHLHIFSLHTNLNLKSIRRLHYEHTSSEWKVQVLLVAAVMPPPHN